jgi:geranylgeranyl diphosphate synthase type II
MLVLEFCRACGGDVESAIPFACALEMIHTYSLIHDDLPCMDDDDFRRGKPSCHKQYDYATALLAGDGLLTLAFSVAASAKLSAEITVKAVKILSDCAGHLGMIGGQTMDLQHEGMQISLDSLRKRSLSSRNFIGLKCLI